NKIAKAAFSFESSKIVEVSGVDENCSCIAKISNGSLYVKAKSSADDNGGKIEIYGDLSLTVLVIREEVKSIVSDGYIVSKKAKNSYSSFDCLTDGQYINNSANAKLSLDLSASVNRIYDLNVTVGDCSVKNKKLCVEFEVCIFAETAEQGIQFITQNKAAELECDDISVASTAFVTSFDYTIVNDKNISVNVMYAYFAYVGKAKKINVLTEMECSDDAVNYPALTLYFAKQNEKLWDIAKQFSSDIELIKKENNITCESLDSNKVIIIPGL
ncbi:MAG: LysM peptidoglycan-binding domain-containing protein, partial [Clostridia bacterium]|nr:LysM peptidoglycan-binding domain-containing protein [Clostridia bacterium]